VIDISKYQGEGGWPAVHNCSSLEHFPIYFGVYSFYFGVYSLEHFPIYFGV
jgi:hypothetical protein